MTEGTVRHARTRLLSLFAKPRLGTGSRWPAAMLGIVLVAVTTGAFPAASAADEPLAAGSPPATADLADLAGKLAPRLADAEGRTTVFVQFDGKPAADAFSERQAAGASRASARQAASAASEDARQVARAVIGQLRAGDSSATTVAVTSNAVPGMIVAADMAEIRELAARPDVQSIRPVVEHVKTSTNSVQMTGTLRAWQDTGHYGDGVRVGIIDDGIDYTHAAFGGPGTPEAYRAIDPTVLEGSNFPTVKVAGGTDLVGDNYDASGSLGSPVPVPDPNPLACGFHGTHGGSIMGSLGVNADGSTFTGDYGKLTTEQLNRMRVGPGVAPKATLYSIKVFGCNGLTSSVTPKAMDWALDPNGDGDFGDRLDIVSMALASEFNSVDDPTSLFVRKLAEHDVLAVFSAGNGGDLYDVGGSPGSLAPESLTVASSRDSYVLRDAARVDAPADLAGIRGGQFSTAFTGWKDLNLSGPVVPVSQDNALGCKAYSPADAAAVAGKLAWIEMDADRTVQGLECGTGARATNARNAGAIGVVLSATEDHFSARLTGTATIPMFQLTATNVRELRPALEAGTLRMTLRGSDKASLPTYDEALTDKVSSFTSRGVRGPVVKPDISAPGDTIAAAWSGTGNDRAWHSGTSYSAPQVTGLVALIRQAHPDWTYEEVKAAAMNTAGHDITDERGQVYAPQRVGAGRMDTAAALTTRVLAYVQDDPGAVSASFGAVEVSRPLAVHKTIKVVNKGNRPADFDVAYDGIVDTPGVRFTLSTDRVRLAPRATARVRVTMRVDNPAALRKKMDPTMSAVQEGVVRQFVTDASGRVVLTPRRGAEVALRVPVAATPQPVANITTPDTVTFRGNRDTARLTLGGHGLEQGSDAQAYRSLVSVVELHGTSPRMPECRRQVVESCTVNGTAKGGDLRYVGATSTAPLARRHGDPDSALLAFGIATWSDWANIGRNTVPFVRIDTTGDGVADFESSVTKPPRTDGLVVNTVDLNRPTGPGRFTTVDVQPVNGHFGDVDTRVFDTNVVVLPVRLAALGIDPNARSHPITYSAAVTGFYRAPGSTVIDQVDGLSFDPLAPTYWLSGTGRPALSYFAEPHTSLLVNRGQAGSSGPSSLLALHHHNSSGDRVDIVRILAKTHSSGSR
jgi:subtilisin family serine protease